MINTTQKLSLGARASEGGLLCVCRRAFAKRSHSVINKRLISITAGFLPWKNFDFILELNVNNGKLGSRKTCVETSGSSLKTDCVAFQRNLFALVWVYLCFFGYFSLHKHSASLHHGELFVLLSNNKLSISEILFITLTSVSFFVLHPSLVCLWPSGEKKIEGKCFSFVLRSKRKNKEQFSLSNRMSKHFGSRRGSEIYGYF